MDSQTQLLIKLLKQKREAQGYSLRKLSSIIGVSFSTLGRIERGDGEPDNNTKIRILEWLGDDARNAGINFDIAALVHFRARKQIGSETVQGLLRVADYLKCQYSSDSTDTFMEPSSIEESDIAISLTKDEMEKMAEEFRKDIGLFENEALDPFYLKVEGVEMMSLADISGIDNDLKSQLLNSEKQSWSAMSIPLEEGSDKWAIIWNSSQSQKRQRVSLLEEIWHILLGHQLTRITKVADIYGRTFAEVEEHDAYYLAAATLLPSDVIKKLVKEKQDISEVAANYGITPNLIEYRIKRLGLWHQYKGMKVTLVPKG
ncbi:XRE family transcriptional regulator [Nostoc sp. FACHB-888]|uniref:XRE family transcriptional regulator n=1 Tax=Nostoc sp. FACHB-888 TaxID=2692842 RepID=UPI00168560DB|nr:XRE family transcriptional regulator [Nostoc sp. FACHB-888]MBD2246543.1 ImmA/IrrE family metallo-endopeptidase [Nostoc sp. FACHB-888]